MRKEIIKYLYMYKRELLILKNQNIDEIKNIAKTIDERCFIIVSKKEVRVLRLVLEP